MTEYSKEEIRRAAEVVQAEAADHNAEYACGMRLGAQRVLEVITDE